MRLHELIDQGERIGRRMAANDDGWIDVEWLITSGKMRKSDLTRSDWQGGFESSKKVPPSAVEFPCCPNCLSTNLGVQRRPDGDATCGNCNWKGPYRKCFVAPECITATQVKERMKDWGKYLDEGDLGNGLRGFVDEAMNKIIKILENYNQGLNMFDTHKLNETGFAQMEAYKKKMSLTISEVLGLMPEGREKAIFRTKIEEAVFFGAKAIAGKEGNYSEIVKYDETK